MKSVTKILLTPLMLCVFALSACGGNGLNNEHEVSSSEFLTKAAVTPANTYATVDEKGYNIINEGEEFKSEYSTRLSWDKNTNAWVAAYGAAYYPVNHIVSEYSIIIGNLEKFEAENEAHFYVADNGFRISANFTKDYVKDAVTATVTVKFEYIWNQFGYPTSIISNINQQIGTAKSKSSLEISFKYNEATK